MYKLTGVNLYAHKEAIYNSILLGTACLGAPLYGKHKTPLFRK